MTKPTSKLETNPDREGSATGNPNNYGEVVLYDMFISHNGSGNVGPATTTTGGGGSNNGGGSSNSGCTASNPSNRTATNITQSSVRFNWSFDNDIDHYNLRYRRTNTSSWTTLTSLKRSENEFTVSGSNARKTISGLRANTNYEWQVRAKCSNGSASPYVNGANFRTSSASSSSSCTANTPNNRTANNVTQSNVRLNWSYNSAIDHYNIRYKRTSSSSNWTYLTSLKRSEGEFNVSGSTASKTISGLRANTSYQWEVRAKCASGSASPYTSGNNFRTSSASNSTAADVVVHIRKRNATGFALDGKGGGANGQNIHLWSQNSGNANQQWVEIDRGGGYYSYRKMNTNFCIDGGRGGSNNQNVYLWTCSSRNSNQQWKKQATDNGAVKLIKRNAQGYAINGGSGGRKGQNVTLYNSSSRSHNLQWFVTPIRNVRPRVAPPTPTEEVESVAYKAPLTVEKLFPNPTSNEVFAKIDLTENTTVTMTVTNVVGQIVEQRILDLDAGRNTISVDLKTKPGGVYQFNFFTDKQFITKKIVKARD